MIQGHEASSMGSTLHHGAPVAERVGRLLASEELPVYGVSLRAWSICLAASMVVIALYPSALPVVHRATEWLLHGVP